MSSRCLTFSLLLLLTGCSNSAPEPFFASEPQETNERVIRGQLVALDSIDLFEAYDISYATSIHEHDGVIYIPNSPSGEVVRFDGDRPGDYEIIELGIGEGPGEVQGIMDIDISGNTMAVADTRQYKTVLTSTDGELIREIRTSEWQSHRLRWITPETLAILAPTAQNHVFHLVSIDEGELFSFGAADVPHNPLKYDGHIQTDGQHLFYAGYAEPILKKYTVRGQPVYSRATIDNFNTDINYVTFGAENDNTALTYSNWALFSSRYVDITDNYWVIVPYPNDGFDDSHNVVDLYRIEDGEYSHSLRLDRQLRCIAVGEDYIFGISITDEEEYYFVRYPNIIDRESSEPVATSF